MKRSVGRRHVKTATFSAIAVFILAVAGGSAKATDVSVNRTEYAGAGSEEGAGKVPHPGTKISLKGSVAENPGFPLLEKIGRDVTTKLQKKIEAEFSKQLEEMLSRQLKNK